MGSTEWTRGVWFDYTGHSEFWNSVPLRTTKKAFYKKGSLIRSLAKMMVNGVMYNFSETAKGGVVIVPPTLSAIEFVSPDGHIDYDSLIGHDLGYAFASIRSVLNENPVKAWDKFANWFGGEGLWSLMSASVASCAIQPLSGAYAVEISLPDFSNVRNMVDILDAIALVAEPAQGQPLTDFQLDNAAFGFALYLTTTPDENDKTVSFAMGFIFRQ